MWRWPALGPEHQAMIYSGAGTGTRASEGPETHTSPQVILGAARDAMCRCKGLSTWPSLHCRAP